MTPASLPLVARLPLATRVRRRLRRERQLWLLSIPMIAWVVVFAYYPMYGILTGFVNYIPGKRIIDSPWVGLLFLKQFLASPDFWLVLRNTLAISGLNILFGFPAPIILALLINELAGRGFKKTVQTISYLPYFISWVVVASLLFTLLGSEGFVNEVLTRVGIVSRPVPFLAEGRYFWAVLTITNIWKGVGWTSIIYLSAIAGIDPELYQAGTVDGLGRFGLAWHITMPGIRTTVILLAILGIGDLLNAGFEQQLLIGNPLTREYHEVIDTYAYRYGIQLGRYSYGTAIGFFKSVIALGLVFAANRIAKRTLDTALF